MYINQQVTLKDPTLWNTGIEITTQGTKQIDEAYLVHSCTQEGWKDQQHNKIENIFNPKYLNPWTKRQRALLKELGNSNTASMYIIRLRKTEKGAGTGEEEACHTYC